MQWIAFRAKIAQRAAPATWAPRRFYGLILQKRPSAGPSEPRQSFRWTPAGNRSCFRAKNWNMGGRLRSIRKTEIFPRRWSIVTERSFYSDHVRLFEAAAARPYYVGLAIN